MCLNIIRIKFRPGVRFTVNLGRLGVASLPHKFELQIFPTLLLSWFYNGHGCTNRKRVKTSRIHVSGAKKGLIMSDHESNIID